ncbi:MAG: YtxH domain-containing protein [Cyclobacteriaceae bacterium]
MNTTSKVIGGFIVGAAVGAAAGILLAPDSGRKTRQKISDESRKLSDQLSSAMSRTLDSAKDVYNKKLEEYAKNGKLTIDNLKEKVKA